MTALPRRDGGLVSERDDVCWCGVSRPWFSTDDLDPTCAGTGALQCYCGGDQCICHWHGEIDCDGCPDCEIDDLPDFYEGWL